MEKRAVSDWKSGGFAWGIWLTAGIILAIGFCSVAAIQSMRMQYEHAMQSMVGYIYQEDAGEAERLLEQLFYQESSDRQTKAEMLRQGEEAARNYGYTDAAFRLWNQRVLSGKGQFFLYGAFFVLTVLGIVFLVCSYQRISRQAWEMEFARKTLEEQLIHAKKYYEEREQDLQQFMENITHQIKTPLAGILMNIELLEEIRTEHDRKLREKSIRQIEKIKKLLMNLLNTARMQAGKIHFHKERMQLDELLEEVAVDYPQVEFQLPQGEDHGKKFEIRADREWLLEAIENIVTNGIRYGAVQMDLSADPEQVYIRILDEGRGISQTESKRIFERYYVSSQQKDDSTGIGLHLSWMVVHSHGGDILVRSAENQGTCIEIRLPKFRLKSKISEKNR